MSATEAARKLAKQIVRPIPRGLSPFGAQRSTAERIDRVTKAAIICDEHMSLAIVKALEEVRVDIEAYAYVDGAIVRTVLGNAIEKYRSE